MCELMRRTFKVRQNLFVQFIEQVSRYNCSLYLLLRNGEKNVVDVA